MSRFMLFGRRRIVGGVTYSERGITPLAKALSHKGGGEKLVTAVFPSGRRMTLHATRHRAYADLGMDDHTAIYAPADVLLKPGMRVALFRCGAGSLAAWVLERVGPFGAVVAVESDAECVRYARVRYGASNASYEVGGLELLRGETDGAFDTVFAVHAVRRGDDADALIAELWRVTRPGGWLLFSAPIGTGLADNDPMCPVRLSEQDFAALTTEPSRTPIAQRLLGEVYASGAARMVPPRERSYECLLQKGQPAPAEDRSEREDDEHSGGGSATYDDAD